MHINVRIHHWVLWWFYLGVACGAIALINILGRELSRTQDKVILLIGAAHWVLGGAVCYSCDGIRFEEPHRKIPKNEPSRVWEQREWHEASDFLLPGNRKSLLPPRH